MLWMPGPTGSYTRVGRERGDTSSDARIGGPHGSVKSIPSSPYGGKSFVHPPEGPTWLRHFGPKGIHAPHISDPGEDAVGQPCLGVDRCLHGWHDRGEAARAAGLAPDLGGEDLEAVEVPGLGVYQPGGGS